MRIVFFLISFFLITMSSFAADITYRDVLGYEIYINGKIEKGDKDKFVKTLLEIVGNNIEEIKEGNFQLIVVIDSNGGDVFESIEIAKIVREKQLPVLIRNNCYSACSFILLSSVDKRVASSLGLHRPYFDKTYFAGLTYEDADVEHKKLLSYTRKYLESVDVPTRYIDLMFSYPSDEMYITSDQDRKHLFGEPPAYSEWVKSKCGSMTKQEVEDYINVSFNQNINASNGYKQYLMEKGSQLNKCNDEIRKNAQLSIMDLK